MQNLSWTFLGVAGAMLASFSVPSSANAGAGNLACVGSGPSVSCAAVWGEPGGFPRIIDIAPYRSDEEQTAGDARDRRWSARCQPVVRRDRYGVGRYYYAAAGCEFGNTED
jgi:hypothetical protein